MSSAIEFRRAFETLTQRPCEKPAPPFPWQVALYEQFIAGRFPPTASLPTGLGKTSILAIWLIALAERPDLVPRRLAYVVNRRTVVDQSTAEAELLRKNLPQCPDVLERLKQLCADDLLPRRRKNNSKTEEEEELLPLAISTLRGQFADNEEWLADPARPAIVAGTVDMIGSRLLFSGYRSGYKSQPRHAGMLGQNTLLVHDEAHLEPAFQCLLESVVREQRSGRFPDRWPLKVLELTATSRSDETRDKPFSLTPQDREHPVVRQRIHAKKGIVFHPVENEKEVAETVARKALEYLDSGQAILVFVRKVDDVERVENLLRKEGTRNKIEPQIELLTGTLRGRERDRLVKESPVFTRFLPSTKKQEGDPTAYVQQQMWAADSIGTEKNQDGDPTVYLICTAAGEVGVNISADHLVCDLTPFDSMAQRFGRVNRFGHGDAAIHIVHEQAFNADKPFEQARGLTLELLRQLPLREDGRFEACPAALGALPPELRQAAFTPPPRILPVDEILFDAWSLTTIRGDLPGRPEVADWLHGEPDDFVIPQTQVAWREEVERLTPTALEWNPGLTRRNIRKGDDVNHRLAALGEELLEVYPLKPHELLQDNSGRVFKHLKRLSERHAGKQSENGEAILSPRVWLANEQGNIQVTTLAELVEAGVEGIQYKTVLLPPSLGGLHPRGMLDGSAAPPEESLDVAGQWLDENQQPRRYRTQGAEQQPKPGMREAVRILLSNPDPEDENTPIQVWQWFVRTREADAGNSWVAQSAQNLEEHLTRAEQFACKLVEKLPLGDSEKQAVVLAAKFHDLGKHRGPWQLSIGNREYPQKVLAKSDGGKSSSLTFVPYRHEFGSLLDVLTQDEFFALNDAQQELLLHLIATHHGRARPHFPAQEVADPNYPDAAVQAMAAAVPERFARLQRHYGRWGLAWLENLVHAADVVASPPSRSKHDHSAT